MFGDRFFIGDLMFGKVDIKEPFDEIAKRRQANLSVFGPFSDCPLSEMLCSKADGICLAAGAVESVPRRQRMLRPLSGSLGGE